MRHLLPYIIVLMSFGTAAQCSCDSLVASIERGDAVAVQNCLDTGADPNCEYHFYRPDSTNTFDENKEVITVAVNYHWRSTPLNRALRADRFDLVKLLIEAGASPNTPEVCLEEVNYNEKVNIRVVPLELAERMPNAAEAVAYLKEHGALTERELERRGRRLQNLSTYYDTDHFTCRDSILKLHELIELWGQDVLLDQEFITERACYANDVILLHYLVETIGVSLKERPGGYVSVGMGIFRRTVYQEGYSPFGALFLPDMFTISTIELLRENGGIPDGEFEEYFLDKPLNANWDDRKVRKYYQLEQKIKTDSELSEKKKEKYRKKMQKIYDQLEERNGIQSRLDTGFDKEKCP